VAAEEANGTPWDGQPTFSIVVPTRGRPRYLRRCLSALAALEYPRDRFEVVVVGDGDDRAAEVLADSLPEEIRTDLALSPGSGPAAARNAGAARARGRFVAFTDDDCAPAPAWLSALESALHGDPGAAAGGRTLNGAAANPCSTVSQAVVDALYAYYNSDPASPRFFASNNVAFPAEGFRAVGGFDTAFRQAGGEDRELCARWLRAGRRLTPAPEAIVKHMRELTLRGFWRQHFGYGRGAWRFHRSPDGSSSGWPALEPRFHRVLAREVRRSASATTLLALAVLAVTSQVASLAGVVREALPLGLARHSCQAPPTTR
jgi:glycosyltransferase involved in cell wall biosynthesis